MATPWKTVVAQKAEIEAKYPDWPSRYGAMVYVATVMEARVDALNVKIAKIRHSPSEVVVDFIERAPLEDIVELLIDMNTAFMTLKEYGLPVPVDLRDEISKLEDFIFDNTPEAA